MAVPLQVVPDRHRLKPEMAPHVVQVIHFGLDGDVVGSDAIGPIARDRAGRNR
jgi:hypothetical protein